MDGVLKLPFLKLNVLLPQVDLMELFELKNSPSKNS
jgi:hypothetical protein